MSHPPPPPTLFPYTTLFRSTNGALINVSNPLNSNSAPASGQRSSGDSNWADQRQRSEEHTYELQSHSDLVCRLLLEKKKFRTMVSSSRCCYASIPDSRRSC